MENYSNLSKLKEKFVEELFKTGMEPSLKENPAFAHALAEMAKLIPDLGEEAEKVSVKIEGKESKTDKITFSFNYNGSKYSYVITSPRGMGANATNNINCERTVETPIVRPNGRPGKRKDCEDIEIRLAPSGEMIVRKNAAYREDTDPMNIGGSPFEAVKWAGRAQEDRYSPDGVMTRSEIKEFKEEEKKAFSLHELPDNILYTTRHTFVGDNVDSAAKNAYDETTIIEREKADVARVTKQRGVSWGFKKIYNSKVRLNQEHGLRDMYLPLGYTEYAEPIEPITPEQSEAAIAKENNPKIKEALRKWNKDRDKYYYNPADDPNYLNETGAKAQTL